MSLAIEALRMVRLPGDWAAAAVTVVDGAVVCTMTVSNAAPMGVSLPRSDRRGARARLALRPRLVQRLADSLRPLVVLRVPARATRREVQAVEHVEVLLEAALVVGRGRGDSRLVPGRADRGGLPQPLRAGSRHAGGEAPVRGRRAHPGRPVVGA